jgi:hypothetical protein
VKTPADGWDADERDALDAIEPLVDELQVRHAGDPSIELLRAARAGVLPEDVERRVSQQLDDNPWNRALVDGVSDDQPGLTDDDRSRLLRRIQQESARDARALADPRPQPRRRLWLWQPAFAMAAAVVIVAATAWLLRGRVAGPVSPEPPAQVAVNTPPEVAPPLLPLDPPTIKISAAALTFRGASDNQLLADLKPAFDAIRVDDYRAAVEEFSTLATQYPTSVEVAYYDGVARLFVDDPNGALASLARAEKIGDSSFAPDITWYQAVALERAGRRDEARARLRALCDQKGPRSVEACAAEPRLTP